MTSKVLLHFVLLSVLLTGSVANALPGGPAPTPACTDNDPRVRPFSGQFYALSTGTRSLPNFATLTPYSSVVLHSLDVP